MRSADITQENLFSTVYLDEFVPANHPLRAIRQLIDEAMGRINWLFDTAYSELGRESVPLERLIRAQLLQAFLAFAVNGNSWNKCTTIYYSAGLLA